MKKKVTKENLKYCQNQKTVFVDEMKGDQRLEHIIFRSGMLVVEKEKNCFTKITYLLIPSTKRRYFL